MGVRISDTGPSPVLSNLGDPDKDEVRIWRNQNGYLARCFEAGITDWDHYAMKALRAGLEGQEEGKELSTVSLECEILAATEWLIHASRKLHRWAEENDEDAANGVYDYSDGLPGGPLFSGRPGLSVARWNFWKERLDELSRKRPKKEPETTGSEVKGDLSTYELFSQEVYDAIENALKRMREVDDTKSNRA
ncbi:hypothetical protein Sste5346_010333 [Sporothrix stenoceras]|uniref:dATP/dGTP diphosphohydrolase N-terminal domain-containing protein n=1 Tax=Sporothrix stenoceras TaxID=5173 RepID=A0ABR3YII6_9PEZI